MCFHSVVKMLFSFCGETVSFTHIGVRAWLNYCRWLWWVQWGGVIGSGWVGGFGRGALELKMAFDGTAAEASSDDVVCAPLDSELTAEMYMAFDGRACTLFKFAGETRPAMTVVASRTS